MGLRRATSPPALIAWLGSRRLSAERKKLVIASVSEQENREIEAANTSGNTPVVFIHGLRLLPSSWARWADMFKQAGYAPLTLGWPDDPETAEQAGANPASWPGRP